jgi:hypothetical protein
MADDLAVQHDDLSKHHHDLATSTDLAQSVDLAHPVDLSHSLPDLSDVDLDGRVCSPTCPGKCAVGACCGSGCCGVGEWCDHDTCRCGNGAACNPGQTCVRVGPIPAGSSLCGTMCCGGGTICAL